MQKYETIFIINPDLTDEDTKGIIEKVNGIIQRLKGETLKIEEWGRRKLAYEIKKMSKGYYVLIHFTGTAEVLNEMERNLRLIDGVLKFQTVRLDKKAEKIAQMLSREQVFEREEPPEEKKGKEPEEPLTKEKISQEATAEPLEAPAGETEPSSEKTEAEGSQS
jgi:small subunit ribosomal protein S6